MADLVALDQENAVPRLVVVTTQGSQSPQPDTEDRSTARMRTAPTADLPMARRVLCAHELSGAGLCARGVTGGIDD